MGAVGECVDTYCYAQFCASHVAQATGQVRPLEAFVNELAQCDPQAAANFDAAFFADQRVLCVWHRHIRAVLATKLTRDCWPDDPAEAVIAAANCCVLLREVEPTRPPLLVLPYAWWPRMDWARSTGRMLARRNAPSTRMAIVRNSKGVALESRQVYEVAYESIYVHLEDPNPYYPDVTVKLTGSGEVYCCREQVDNRVLRPTIFRSLPMTDECDHLRKSMFVDEAVKHLTRTVM